MWLNKASNTPTTCTHIISVPHPSAIITRFGFHIYQLFTFRILYKKETKLIAVHKATYFKVPKGVILGPGPFIEALESAAGKKALFVGKPDQTFFYSVIKDLDSTAEETVMIGDVCNNICYVMLVGNKFNKK